MNLDTSVQTQNLQSSIKAADIDSFLHLEFTRTENKWSNKPTSPYTPSCADALSDIIGHEGIEKLEETVVEFIQWCSSQIEIMKGKESSQDSSPEKRTHVYMSQESYIGSEKLVYSTHHM